MLREMFKVARKMKMKYFSCQSINNQKSNKPQQTLYRYMHYIPSIRELQTDDIEYLGARVTLVVLHPLPHLHREVVLTRHINHIQISQGPCNNIYIYMYSSGWHVLYTYTIQ